MGVIVRIVSKLGYFTLPKHCEFSDLELTYAPGFPWQSFLDVKKNALSPSRVKSAGNKQHKNVDVFVGVF